MKAYGELLAIIHAQLESASIAAEHALWWLMYSIGLIKSQQLVAAVCQDTERDDMRPVDVDIDFVLHACRNLLVVDAQQDTSGFSHLSVQGYFETGVLTLSEVHEFSAKTTFHKDIPRFVE